MSPSVALEQLLAAIESNADASRTKGSMGLDTTLALSLSRLGAPTQKIVAGTLRELSDLDASAFGDPLHAVVIAGNRLHPLEVEFAKPWAVGEGWVKTAREHYGVKPE